MDTSLSILVLRQAFKQGVTYWDTANTYMGGRSEKGTQGGGQVKTNTEAEFKLAGRFVEKGTLSTYCAGCDDICESAVAGNIPIGDVMRYLMYARSYDNPYRASTRFRKIPLDIRLQIATADYSMAEDRCPQKMAIGRLMQEALKELS